MKWMQDGTLSLYANLTWAINVPVGPLWYVRVEFLLFMQTFTNITSISPGSLSLLCSSPSDANCGRERQMFIHDCAEMQSLNRMNRHAKKRKIKLHRIQIRFPHNVNIMNDASKPQIVWYSSATSSKYVTGLWSKRTKSLKTEG